MKATTLVNPATISSLKSYEQRGMYYLIMIMNSGKEYCKRFGTKPELEYFIDCYILNGIYWIEI